jgi:heat shock protein 4
LQVNDGFPFSIALSWKQDSQNSAPQQTIVFPKGNAIPSIKALTFYKSSTFEVDVLYVDTGDSQIPQKISTYTVSNPCTVFMLYYSSSVAICYNMLKSM